MPSLSALGTLILEVVIIFLLADPDEPRCSDPLNGVSLFMLEGC